MEVTIKLSENEIAAIHQIGKDGGRLDYYVDGYYWGDETAACEKAIVKLHEAVAAKEQKILEEVNRMILESTNTTDWVTAARIFQNIQEKYREQLTEPDFKEAFNLTLIANQCTKLVEGSRLSSHEIIGIKSAFYVYRRKAERSRGA